MMLILVTGNYWVIRILLRKEISYKNGRKILDIGSGTGIVSRDFTVKDYTGIEINPELAAYAKRKYRKKFLVMDARKLIFSRNFFDTIIVVGVIHHLSDRAVDKALREMRRVVKPDGQVILIEAIAPISPFNILGKILRANDEGKHIRTLEKYAELFSRHFTVKKSYQKAGGLFDYGVFVLSKSHARD